jgi:hypothetical protein
MNNNVLIIVTGIEITIMLSLCILYIIQVRKNTKLNKKLSNVKEDYEKYVTGIGLLTNALIEFSTFLEENTTPHQSNKAKVFRLIRQKFLGLIEKARNNHQGTPNAL